MRELVIQRLEKIMLTEDKSELNYRFNVIGYIDTFANRHKLSDKDLLDFFEDVVHRWYRQH